MNIYNFEKWIDELILERGYEIFEEQHYSDFQQNGNQYSMIAHGTKDYFVEVVLDDELNIIENRCNCPYDYTPICKHTVALLYEINEQLDTNQEIEHSNLKTRIENIVSTLSRETIEKLLIEQIMKDEDLYKDIIFNFDKDENKIELAINTTKEAILRMNHLYEFSHYDEDEELSGIQSEMYNIYHQAETSSSPQLAFQMLIAVIHTANVATSEDDYEQTIVDDAIFSMKKVLNKYEKDESIRCQLYEQLEKQLNQYEAIYDDSTIAKYISLMADTNCSKYKDQFMKRLQNDEDKYSDYEYMLHHTEVSMFKHLHHFYDKNDAKTYAFKRVYNEKLILLAYDLSMQDGQYEDAVKLANILLNQFEKYWFKTQYEEKLANALLAAKRDQEAKPILKKLVLSNREEAYHKYIRILKEEELNKEIDALVEAFMQSSSYEKLFKLIAVEHHRYEDLMIYAEKHPSNIMRLADVLVDQFEERVYHVYEKHIYKVAEEVGKRSHYRHIANMIDDAKKYFGHRVEDIRYEIISMYPRRSALKEELTKKNFKFK
jgi:hypothetical protein